MLNETRNEANELRPSLIGCQLGQRLGPSLVAALAFLSTLFLRSPGLFLHPRFWAEEGTLYYGQLQNQEFAPGMVHVVNGNYQFLTNSIVEIALLVPVRWSAYVTTYLSLAVAVACAAMIASLFLRRHCCILSASAVCAVFALQPAGYEVFLSATNVQWLTSLIGLLLCVSENVPATSRKAILRYGLLLACGLTGTTTCILLPIFAVAALRRRAFFGWSLVGVLIVATAIQAFVVVVHHHDLERRPFHLSEEALLALILQSVFAQFLPLDGLDRLGFEFAARSGPIMVLAVAVAVAIVVLAHAVRGKVDRLTREVLLGAIVVAPLVNQFGALSPAKDMLLGLAGARYFFLGGTCFLILLGTCLTVRSPLLRMCGALVFAWAALNGISTAAFADWTKPYLDGPSVAEQVDQCTIRDRCEIRVWPTWVRRRLVVHLPR